jgi:hypothetical protein
MRSASDVLDFSCAESNELIDSESLSMPTDPGTRCFFEKVELSDMESPDITENERLDEGDFGKSLLLEEGVRDVVLGYGKGGGSIVPTPQDWLEGRNAEVPLGLWLSSKGFKLS